MRVFLATLLFASSVQASDLVHQFSSPAFSGNGWSTHVLTIDQLERQRARENRDDVQAAIDKADREYKSSNLYKFKNNLESRIYAQLSKQIADAMFGEDAATGDTDWVESETPFGDRVRWRRYDGDIYVEIYDSNGDLASEFITPVGDFAF